MKKNFIGAIVLGAMTLGACSCSCGSGDSCAADDSDSIVINKQTSDSLVQAYGQMVGLDINNSLAQYAMDSGEVYDKKSFVKGLQFILGDKYDDAFYAGVSSALRILSDVRSYEQSGVQVDREMLLRELRNAIMQDSVDENYNAEVQGDFRKLEERVNRMITDARASKAANTPEGVRNRKTAEAFINHLKAQGVQLIEEPTGAYTQVEVQGEGQPAQNSNVAVIDVVATRLNGEKFFEREDLEVIPANGPIPGIREALLRVAKGGVVTVYVPGQVAFGPEGAPQLGIAPMEMVVYHITVKDIIVNAADRAAADNE